MGIEGFFTRHLCISMIVLHIIVIHNDGKCAADNLFVYHGYNLSFGENSDEFFNLFVCPKHIAAIRIYTGEWLRQLLVVFYL